jgi:hypothetical protein
VLCARRLVRLALSDGELEGEVDGELEGELELDGEKL